MNLDLLEKTRIELSKKNYSICLDYLNEFFDDLKGTEEKHFWGIVKLFDVVETRYNQEVKARKNTETALFDAFVIKFERVILTLLDLLVWEVKRFENESGRHLKIVLVAKDEKLGVWNKAEQKFSVYKSEEVVFKQIRSCFKEYHKNIGDDYKYLFRNGAYIYLGWYCKRDYELLWKLKSVSRLQVIHYLDSIKCLDAYMDDFCEALTDFQLNFGKMKHFSRYIQEYLLRLMAQKKDKKHDWLRALEDSFDVVISKIEKEVLERTGKHLFNRGVAFAFNFSWANLQQCNLSSIKFTDSSFVHANMHKIYLLDMQLVNCNLDGVNFSNGNLSNVSLINTSLNQVNFFYSDLNRVNLTRANFNNVDFRNVRISRSDLNGANFSNVDFSNAGISGSDLSGTNFNKVNLSNVRLTNSDLTGAKFNKAKLFNTSFQHSNLSNVDFSKATFLKGFLSERDIIGVVFSKTIFHLKYKENLERIGVNLKNCILVDDNGAIL